jgi:hypothetical protein
MKECNLWTTTCKYWPKQFWVHTLVYYLIVNLNFFEVDQLCFCDNVIP